METPRQLTSVRKVSVTGDGTGFITLVAAPANAKDCIHLRVLKADKKTGTGGIEIEYQWSSGSLPKFGHAILFDGFTLQPLQLDFRPDTLRGPPGAALQYRMVDAGIDDVTHEAFYWLGPPTGL